MYSAISEGGEGAEQSSTEWQEAREEGGEETGTGEVRDVERREGGRSGNVAGSARGGGVGEGIVGGSPQVPGEDLLPPALHSL